MLLKLLILRIGPLASLLFLKDRKQIKMAVRIIMILYGLCLVVAGWKIVEQEKWRSILLLPIFMFPQYLFYFFSIWIIVRCIWRSWSIRVWKRIYFLSILSVIAGILLEKYVNFQILQIFFKIFK